MLVVNCPCLYCVLQLHQYGRQRGLVDARWLHAASPRHLQGPCQCLYLLPAARPSAAPAPTALSLPSATATALSTQPSQPSTAADL